MRHHSGADMNGNSAELFAHYLTLTRVDASPDLDIQALDRIGNSPAATGGPGGPIEGRQKAIACGINLAATIALKLLAHHEVVLTKKLFPCTVTHLCCSLRCADDVGEEHCGKHTVRLRRAAIACHEGLDFIAKRANITYPR